ncbi:MAG: response regulator transcription factor [Lachnospiraceae bacterium]|nr:response regulator transcription factor [Lachnospiraceae bacterium]
MKYDCLIIDDEKMLADSTAEYFNMFGVSTAVSYSASECRAFLEEHTAELLLLDINLGDGSGFELCKELREKMEIPIIFISARTSDDDQIIALNIGGDDYVQKPYSLGVLMAKVKAVKRRLGGGEAVGYSDERINVDFDKRQVLVDGSEVKLTSLEFKLLSYLIKNENKVVTKQELFQEVWGDKFTGDGTLNVHIRKIREAIEIDPGTPKYIVTVWGDGYKFVGGK